MSSIQAQASVGEIATVDLSGGLKELCAPTTQIESAFRYAGFAQRFLAFVIDACILGVALLVPFYGVSWALAALPLAAALLNGLIAVSIGWVYFAGLETSARQGTVGKMVLGLSVTDLEGQPVSLVRASVRYLTKAVSCALFCLGFAMIMFSTRRQALHDMMSGCLVIQK